MEATVRADLRRALLGVAPWISNPDFGPQTVDAGMCDRCGEAPRLLPTCGPEAPGAICRDCAQVLGPAAWCDGHRHDAIAALTWAGDLPDDWTTTVITWWIATGEIADGPSTTTSPPDLSR